MMDVFLEYPTYDIFSFHACVYAMRCRLRFFILGLDVAMGHDIGIDC